METVYFKLGVMIKFKYCQRNHLLICRSVLLVWKSSYEEEIVTDLEYEEDEVFMDYGNAQVVWETFS